MTRAAVLALLPATMKQLQRKTGKSQRWIYRLMQGRVWNVQGVYEIKTETANMEG